MYQRRYDDVDLQGNMGKYKVTTQDNRRKMVDIIKENDGLYYKYLKFIDEFSKYNMAEGVFKNKGIEKKKYLITPVEWQRSF